jgi:DNA (cytosine-5)-methyltransferase 1
LVEEVFRLIAVATPTWLVLENVLNMLSLHRGSAIAHITRRLEDDGWNWAYRTVDSQYFGVPQRRRRVFLVASREEDPRRVLFADDAPPTTRPRLHPEYGFYWTEGNTGLGWGDGIVPTLKGGSKLGISSPPAVWRRNAPNGLAIVRPSISSGEQLQGFPAGWTDHVPREGNRWKLVGNAVSVPVAKWLGRRLADPGDALPVDVAYLPESTSWPRAAANVGGERQSWSVSERPVLARRTSLGNVLDTHSATPLSLVATRGFATRLAGSRLRERVSGFVDALDQHVIAMS